MYQQIIEVTQCLISQTCQIPSSVNQMTALNWTWTSWESWWFGKLRVVKVGSNCVVRGVYEYSERARFALLRFFFFFCHRGPMPKKKKNATGPSVVRPVAFILSGRQFGRENFKFRKGLRQCSGILSVLSR